MRYLVGKRTGHSIAMAWLLVGAMLLCGLAPVLPVEAQPAAAQGAALMIAAQGQYDALQAAVAGAGLAALHAMPPTALVVVAAPATTDAWVAQGLAARVYRTAVSPAALAALPEAEGFAVAAWNAFLAGPTGDTSKDHGEGVPFDTLTAADYSGLSAYGLDPTLYQQSEYLIGKVAVNIVLVESNGAIDPSTEDWTPAERQLVFQQVVASLTWWQTMEPRAHLQFVYDDHFTSPIPTSYEPINRSHSDERLWITEAMGALGYSQPSYITAVRLYNRATRQRLGADWAFTIFVVDSTNDPDNHFADGYFAYAYVHGPFLVMTSENNGYGANNLAAVAAHEMGHIFGALDQYPGAGVPTTTIAGYLGVPCGNSEYGGNVGVDSIMRGGITPYTQRLLDVYAAGQLGWRDSDGDGVLDPVDTSVTATATATGSETGLELAGTAVEVPYPSPTRNPLSINTVASAQYRINGGPWVALAAADGAFGSASETFATTLPLPPVGTWQIEVSAANTAGNTGVATVPLAVTEGAAAIATSVEATATAAEDGGVATLTGVALTQDGASVVTAVEYQLDSGAWQPLTAADGAFDSAREAFTVTVSGLTAGTHSFAVRSWTASPWTVAQVWQQGLELTNTQSVPVSGDLYVPLVAGRRG